MAKAARGPNGRFVSESEARKMRAVSEVYWLLEPLWGGDRVKAIRAVALLLGISFAELGKPA